MSLHKKKPHPMAVKIAQRKQEGRPVVTGPARSTPRPKLTTWPLDLNDREEDSDQHD